MLSVLTFKTVFLTKMPISRGSLMQNFHLIKEINFTVCSVGNIGLARSHVSSMQCSWWSLQGWSYGWHHIIDYSSLTSVVRKTRPYKQRNQRCFACLQEIRGEKREQMETGIDACLGSCVTLTSEVSSCHLRIRSSTCPPWLQAALAG